MRALVQPSVAKQLVGAQNFLRHYKYGLKIWDAYRPESVQRQLWQVVHDESYVTNPEDGVGSLHTWGVAVDATLVDARGRSVRMPSDFDEFTPAAMLHYHGMDSLIGSRCIVQKVARCPTSAVESVYSRSLGIDWPEAARWGLRTLAFGFTICWS